MINYNYIDSNFAFWHTGIMANMRQPDIHLNFWADYYNKTSFIDIGIRFFKNTIMNQFFIYVPFEINLPDIDDLFEFFSYEEVVCGIFNKTCNIKRKVPNSFIEISIENEKEKIIPLIKLGLTISQCGQGTILCLNIDNINSILNTSNAYIRWRMQYLNFVEAVKKRHIGNFSIDSPYVNNNFRCFFRINEIRNLPSVIKQKMNTDISYFGEIILVLISSNQIEINTQECYKIRMLEQDLFKKYKPEVYKEKNSNVFQWRISHSNSGNIVVDAHLKELN